jgi:hypothetical protein
VEPPRTEIPSDAFRTGFSVTYAPASKQNNIAHCILQWFPKCETRPPGGCELLLRGAWDILRKLHKIVPVLN